jgi:hypoxanthine phosphoribosyltransferase
MKLELPYDQLKGICKCLSEQLEPLNLDCIVAISRGGLTAAHLISKELGIPCEFYIPSRRLLTLPIEADRVAFVEDLIAKGRTYDELKQILSLDCWSHLVWDYVPIVIDDDYEGKDNFPYFGMKTKHWVSFPYEDNEKVVEQDRGLFRDGSDSYGK